LERGGLARGISPGGVVRKVRGGPPVYEWLLLLKKHSMQETGALASR
jgi:hypothetical protein